MRLPILFLLYLGLRLSPLMGQDLDLASIRADYYETSRLIEESLDSYEKEGRGLGLYRNELLINSLNGSWRAVGDYQEHIRFWYSDDPRVDPDYQENQKLSCLKRIVLSKQVAAEKSELEFQYLDGQLVFIFQKADPERRIYLQDGEAFRVLIGDEVYDENNRLLGEEYLRVLSLIGESSTLVKQFLAVFFSE